MKKGALRNFTKFTENWPKACNFIKKRLWHRCFPGNFAKFSRTPFLQNTSGRLLLPFDIELKETSQEIQRNRSPSYICIKHVREMKVEGNIFF